MRNPMSQMIIYFIRMYKVMTKNVKHRCAHIPSCSDYISVAYETYGFREATKMSMYRLFNCDLGMGVDLPYHHPLRRKA